MKRVFALMFAFVLISAAQMASSQTISPILTISLNKQEPYPVEPGDIVSIEIAFSNNGDGRAENVTLQIEPKSPFTLVPGEKRTERFVSIEPKSTKMVTYKLKVNKFAPSGSYEVDFLYSSGNSNIKTRKSITIEVSGKPRIVVEGVELSPEQVKPGDIVRMSVKIKNYGTGKAYHIDASFSSKSEYIVPVYSGSVYYIDSLAIGEEDTLEFMFSVDMEAEYKTYNSEINIGYEDENKNKYESNVVSGIPVRGEPVVDVLSYELDNNELKVDIENLGTASAKAIKISLIQDNEIRDISVISELKASRHKTVRFKNFDFGKAKLNISYMNERNEKVIKDMDLVIKSRAEGKGKEDDSMLLTALFILVIVELAYIIKLRREKK
ncbi:MAG TPA: hypothetical protein ENG42_03380 [Candidatus Aenigmarchaeota archaeon]|nr:MAG: hypothetical protein DRP03_02145 [Candidatus Aenigmarchaeota archaeon]HDD46494.1 hypothetical protein [Candidatus Aenigmarchaeota archaeon]